MKEICHLLNYMSIKCLVNFFISSSTFHLIKSFIFALFLSFTVMYLKRIQTTFLLCNSDVVK